MPLDVVGVVKILVSAAGKPLMEKAKRQEAVLALLKRTGLNPKVPPTDFEAIYTYTLIEYCYGQPEPIVRFFQTEAIRSAFKKAFERGDPGFLAREAEEVIQWNDETAQLGVMDYDFRREFAGFTVVFNTLIDRTRTAVETRGEVRDAQRHEELQLSLQELRSRLQRLPTLDDVRSASDESIRKTTVDGTTKLASDVRTWFDALGYAVERELAVSEPEFALVINVPNRRRYDRIVVMGAGGEINHEHVEQLAALVAAEAADEGWVVGARRVSSVARALAQSSPLELSCYTFDELVDDDVDFEPYLTWLDGEVQRRGIDTRYVPLGARKQEFKEGSTGSIGTSDYPWDAGGLDGYVDAWLSDPSKDHLSVLGEFGTGKTWFTMHYAWHLSAQYRAAKKAGLPRPRLPLLIPLRDYAKAVSVESLFSEFFFRRHQVQLASYKVFDRLNRMGRLLLIFDGFDEMAARIDRQAMVNNFWELAKAAVPGAKVLLTCRTEHFPEAREGRALLGAQLRASTSSLTGEPPEFEVIDIAPLATDQVRRIVENLTDPPTVSVIMGNPTLLDLLRRPVMSELVVDALPEISAGSVVDLARVFLYAVRRKMSRDIKDARTFTSMSDKLYFLAEVSWEMLSTDQMSLNYRAFPDRLRACFGEAVSTAKDLDHWHYDMMGQTMLIRNNEGDYAPAHRSLIEFFAAFKAVAQLGLLADDFMSLINDGDQADTVEESTWSEYFSERGRPVSRFSSEETTELYSSFGSLTFTRAAIDLMTTMIRDRESAIERLVAVLRGTRDHPDEQIAGLAGGNIASLLLSLDPAALAGRDMRRVRIDGCLFYSIGLKHESRMCDFTGTDFSGASFAGVDFENCVLTGADMRSASFDDLTYFGWGNDCVRTATVDTDAGRVFFATASSQLYEWALDSGSEPRLICRLPVKNIEEVEYVGFGSITVIFVDDGSEGAIVVDAQTGHQVMRRERLAGNYSHIRNDDGLYHVLRKDAAGKEEALQEAATVEAISAATGQAVARSQVPFYSSMTYYAESAGTTIHVTPIGEIYSMTLTAGELRFEKICEIPQPADGIAMSVGFDGNFVWATRSAKSDLNTTTAYLYDLSGQEMWRRPFAQSLAFVEAGDPGMTAAYNEAERIAVLNEDSLLVAYAINDSAAPLWTASDVPEIIGIRAVFGRSEFVVITRLGIVQIRRFLDGLVINEFSTLSGYEGLLLNSSSLSPGLAHALRLAGASLTS